MSEDSYGNQTPSPTAAFMWAGAIFLVAMGLLLGLVMQWSWRDHMADAHRIAAGLARGSATEMGRRIDMADAALIRMITLAARTGRGDRGGIIDIQSELAAVVAETGGLAEIVLTDATGVPVLTAPKPMPSGTSLADRDYFVAQRAHDRGLLLDHLILGRASGLSVLPMSRRISGSDGKFKGVGVVTFRVADSLQAASAAARPYMAELSIHDMDGVALAPSVLAGNPNLPPAVAARAAETETGSVISDDQKGERRLWSWYRLPKVAAVVAVSLPVEGIRDEWQRHVLPAFAFAVTALAGLSVLGTVALRRVRAEHKAQERVTRASRALELLVAEKDVLLAEIHHRVKNNMQVIINLLTMEALRVSDTGTKRSLDALTQRIALIGRVHEHVYATECFTRLDLSAQLGDYFRSLAGRFPNAVLDLDIGDQPVTCSLDKALPLSLIAHELVTNAFRHGGSTPIISAQLRLSHQDIELIVMDSGRGPAEGNKTGLGLSLIAALAEQIGATISESSETGYAVRVLVPHQELEAA